MHALPSRCTFGAATQSPTVDPASYTVRQLVVRLYTFVFNFNYDTTPVVYLFFDRLRLRFSRKPKQTVTE